jgi:hypothetical protein
MGVEERTDVSRTVDVVVAEPNRWSRHGRDESDTVMDNL